jgi:myo-inositol-1-phosphate synthase
MPSKPLLIMIAGLKGAVGSTVAVTAATIKDQPERIIPYLTTVRPDAPPEQTPKLVVAGWDADPADMTSAIRNHRLLPPRLWEDYQHELDQIEALRPPADLDFEQTIDHLIGDIKQLQATAADAQPVLINLLPANIDIDHKACEDEACLRAAINPACHPDLCYAFAAVRSGVPVVNFSPNNIEVPALLAAAKRDRIPLAGRDGKTGQTYFKVALASALKSRCLKVDGWYSLNILGNADGLNLMDPDRAAGKVANKTDLLDQILGYRVGEDYGTSTHAVRIDYYPPRGDAKEAWDVIDLKGLFDLPMSIRVNLQGRDSILAAPMAIDLARWVAALQRRGYGGPIPELAFFFKKPVGDKPPLTFQDQTAALAQLQEICWPRIAE